MLEDGRYFEKRRPKYIRSLEVLLEGAQLRIFSSQEVSRDYTTFVILMEESYQWAFRGGSLPRKIHQKKSKQLNRSLNTSDRSPQEIWFLKKSCLSSEQRTSVTSLKNYFKVRANEQFLVILVKLDFLLKTCFTITTPVLIKHADKIAAISQASNLMEQSLLEKALLCFTGSWRRRHSILFIVWTEYVSSAGKLRVRVQIKDSQGLIMHILLNLKPEESQQELIKYLLNNYNKLTRIVLVYPLLPNRQVDLTAFYSVRETFSLKYVFLMGLTHEGIQDDLLRTYEPLPLEGNLLYEASSTCVWVYQDQLVPGELEHIKSTVHSFQKRQRQVWTNLFKSYQPKEPCYHEKYFIVRITAFYENYTSIRREKQYNKMHLDSHTSSTNLPVEIDESLHESVQQYIASQVDIPSQEKIGVQKYSGHFPKLLRMASACAVCLQHKPKYTCIDCSQKFERKFGLCPNDCFRLFHLDTARYSDKLKPRSNQALLVEEKEEKRQSVEAIMERWKSVGDGSEKAKVLFKRNCSLGFFHPQMARLGEYLSKNLE